MKAATRQQSENTIVDVSGDIDMGTSPRLLKLLLECLPKTPRMVVNFSDVRYIDTSGIASMVEVLIKARNSHKRLILSARPCGTMCTLARRPCREREFRTWYRRSIAASNRASLRLSPVSTPIFLRTLLKSGA